MASKKKVSLPPELAKLIAYKDALAAAKREGERESEEEALANWLQNERSRKMLRLLKHYGLDRRDPLAFHRLALYLAITYVPGFRIAGLRGRPKLALRFNVHNSGPRSRGSQALDNNSASLKAFAAKWLNSRRGAGRPRSGVWSGREHELLSLYEHGKNLLVARRERVTNYGALLAIYRQHLTNKVADHHLRDWAEADAKRLSEVRKTLRKITEK